jgi:hypothetical protein
MLRCGLVVDVTGSKRREQAAKSVREHDEEEDEIAQQTSGPE